MFSETKIFCVTNESEMFVCKCVLKISTTKTDVEFGQFSFIYPLIFFK